MACASCAACNCRKIVGGDDELIERGRDVAVLDAWVARDPEFRRWSMRPYVAGHVSCVLTDCRKNEATSWATAWEKEFGPVGADPDEARAAAVQAIDAGEV